MFLLGKMPRVNDCKLVLCSADFFCIGVLFCFYVHTWGYILFFCLIVGCLFLVIVLLGE